MPIYMWMEEQWWQPWPNTLLYMPLDSTNTNSDVLWHTTTIWGIVRFWSYGGVDCADFTGRWNISITPFALGSSYTILARANNISGTYESSYWWRVIDLGNPRVWIAYINSNGYYTYENNDYFWVTTQNAWFLTAVVVTGSTWVGYLKGNGVDGTSALVSCFNSGTPTAFNIGNEYNNGANRRFLGYISNVIVEDKARTAQEIADYYNLTKSNYWL